MVPALLVLAAVTVALVGWRPKWAPLRVGGRGHRARSAACSAETLKLPQWLRNISPFEHVPAMPAASFELLPTVLLTTIAVGLTLLGIVAMNRRDIG